MPQQHNLSRRKFLKTGTALAAASIITPQALFATQNRRITGTSVLQEDIFQKFKCPQWFKDAKFGLWLHWGPQTIPTKGGGWYASHMYIRIPRYGTDTAFFEFSTFCDAA
ncbi:hypothetical protein EZS27_035654, partial [termite gut metagenome]